MLIVGAAAVGFAVKDRPTSYSARPPGERPELALLTSLPIVFPERFTLDGSKPAALAALESRYRVVPINIADAKSLQGRRLLLMAQPHAQTAEALVDLDAWVRRGGRVLLLADPALEWPTERALGDLSRPPAAFADTGLLSHWGLRLDAPSEAGPRAVSVDGKDIHTVSPGRLIATSSNCTVGRSALVARCRIGRGLATLVADADFLGVEHVEGSNQTSNLGLLLSELGHIEQ